MTTTLVIKSNASTEADVLVSDMGIKIPYGGGSETFTDHANIARCQSSSSLFQLCTDDAYGVDSSTLILNNGSDDIPQDAILAFLSAVVPHAVTHNDAGYDQIVPPQSTAMREPTGFENAVTDVTISWSDSTKKLTVAPTGASFTLWQRGVKFIKTTETKDISAVIAEGFWYFYYNDAGVLQASQTLWSFDIHAPVAHLYWDATNAKAICVEWEAHNITMDWTTHKLLHSTDGMRYASGLLATATINGDGSANSHAQIDVTAGTVFDEDIQIDITRGTGGGLWQQDLALPAKIPVCYLDGATPVWRRKTANSFPLLEGTNRIKYNLNTAGTWSQAEVSTNGYFVAVWLFATGDIHQPIVAILGQREDITLSMARDTNTRDSLVLSSIMMPEMRVIARLIIQTSSLYTNTPRAAIRDIQDLRSQHEGLTGRGMPGAHPSIALTLNTTNFNNAIDPADDTVQKAMDRLDDAVTTGLAKDQPGAKYLGSLFDYASSGGMTTGEVQYTRIWFTKGFIVNRMRYFVTGGSSASRYVNVGLYDQANPEDEDGDPRNRVAYTGSHNSAGTDGTYRTINLTSPTSYTIPASGYYWIAIVADSNALALAVSMSMRAGFMPVRREGGTGSNLPATAGTLTNPTSAIAFAAAIEQPAA